MYRMHIKKRIDLYIYTAKIEQSRQPAQSII